MLTLATRSAGMQAGTAARSTRRSLACRSQHQTSGLGRRVLLGVGTAGLLTSSLAAKALPFNLGGGADERKGEVYHTDEEWKQLLSGPQYYVLRKEGTEPPFTSELNNEKRTGTFLCAGCGAPLFSSSTKYNSGTGWPSFYDPLPGAVKEEPDNSIMFMPRTEVRCRKCEGHLGHVFTDGPRPTGLRYCMNGLALKFQPADA